MKKIPLTKGRWTLVDDQDYDYLSQWNWHFAVDRYAARTVRETLPDGSTRCNKIYMHREVLQRKLNRTLTTADHCDHRDGDGTDNTRDNLRSLTMSENTKMGKALKKLSRQRYSRVLTREDILLEVASV